MSRMLLTTTSIALLAAMPAVAGSLADPVVDPAPTFEVAEPVSDWSGFYAGLNGTGVVDGGTTFLGFGAQAGYLHDMGDFVVGGEVNYSYLPGGPAHIAGVDAIFGYDAGDVMPHLTVGGTYLWPSNFAGVSAGAGLSVKATDNIILTARYRYSYYPNPASSLHQGILAVSYRF